MENEEKLSLPIYRNWVAFKQGNPCRGYSEYELFTDAAITGENTTDFGPYQFLNPCSSRKGQVKVGLIVRIDNRLSDKYQASPNMEETDTSCYHGGGLTDEIAAIISLAMGVRFKAGRLIREFTPSHDNFGRPIGWYDQIIPDIDPEHGLYKLPSVVRTVGIQLLEPFKCFPDFLEKDVILFVKAARLYQEALWIAESDPSLSWIMFVSALETAANQWRKSQETASERLKFAKKDLYDYLVSVNIPNIIDKVAGYISDSLGASRKFVDFVMMFIPQVPDKRPPQCLQHPWDNDKLRETMKSIYEYRSQALHGGTPFPLPMCEVPYKQKDFYAPAEKPIGLAAFANSGVWVNKDTPMLLNTFEYITRNCLLKWWSQLPQKS